MARPKTSKGAKKQQLTRSEETEYDNTNTGVLFENTRKKTKKHPDFQGSFTDKEGVEFWVSGWERESRDGQYYISLAFTEKDAEEEEEIEEEEEDEKPRRGKRSSGKRSSGKGDELPF
jgi:hypothetical protein